MSKILAVLLMRPYPWLFVAVGCVLVAFTPAIWRYYSEHHWRIPLWHFFVAVALAATGTFSALDFINAIHRQDETLFLWGSVDPEHWDDPAVRATIPYTPIPDTIRELLVRAATPILFTLCVSLVWTWYHRAKRRRLVS